MKRGVLIIVGVVFLVVLTVVLLLLRHRTATPQASNSTITIWGPFDEGSAYSQLSQTFTAAHANVKVDYKYIAAKDSADYEAKVVNAIAGGTGPDIWLLRTDWLLKHQSKLAPSTGLVSWSSDKGLSDQDAVASYFSTAVASQNSLDNKLYAYPFAVDSLALFINRNILNATRNSYEDAHQTDQANTLQTLPATWADVAKWSQLLTKKDKSGAITQTGLAMGTVANTYAATDVLTAILAQYNGSLYSADGKTVNLNLADSADSTKFPGQEALDLYSSFARSNNNNYSWNKNLGDPVAGFVSGKVAMMVGYSGLSTQIFQQNKNFDGTEIVPLPQVNDPDLTGKRTDFAAYWSYGVSKASAHQALAWQYLQSLGGSKNYDYYTKQTGKPTLGSVDSAAKITVSARGLGETTLFADQVAHANPVYKPEWQGVDNALEDMIRQVTDLGQSTSTAVDSTAQALKAAIQ